MWRISVDVNVIKIYCFLSEYVQPFTKSFVSWFSLLGFWQFFKQFKWFVSVSCANWYCISFAKFFTNIDRTKISESLSCLFNRREHCEKLQRQVVSRNVRCFLPKDNSVRDNRQAWALHSKKLTKTPCISDLGYNVSFILLHRQEKCLLKSSVTLWGKRTATFLLWNDGINQV